MTRVLLIATTTGYQIRSFGRAADALGVRLVFASDRCDRLDDPWWDDAVPVRFHDETASLEAIRAAFGDAAPDGIVAVGDRPAGLAAHVASAFGMAGHPPAAAEASRNKLATRRALQGAGLPVPWFHPLELDRLDLPRGIPYPVVLKPLALSGSRGVIRADTPEALGAAVDRLRRLLQSPDVLIERDEAHRGALVESFVPGAEFAVEALLEHGRFRLLAIFDKPDPLDGPFFEETIYATPSRTPGAVQDRIADAVAAAARALGLRHGPIHAECRVDLSTRGANLHDRPVYVLEVAARPIGGLCSRALRFVTGGEGGRGEGKTDTVSLEEVLLRHALGEDVSGFRRESRASGVMMIPIPRRGVYRGVDGLEAAGVVDHVESVEITAKPDAALIPLPEGRSYLGFIFARASEPGAVVQALRGAHAALRFRIDREIPVS